MVLDLQRYTRDFLRQPSERCKSETLVVPGSGNAGLNAAVGDYTAAADRQTSMYSKVANRASAASAVRPRLEFDIVYQFTFKRFEKTLRYRVVPAVAFSTAPAARSYFAPRVNSSAESAIQRRRIVHPDPTGSSER